MDAPNLAQSRVLIGLGSNLGDRHFYLRRAFYSLKKALKNMTASSIYESEALVPKGAPASWKKPYLNLVIQGESSLSPEALLFLLKDLEKTLGRQKKERWSPRVIDLDLLEVGGKTWNSESLTLPHPEILHRPFVLLPLLELEPEWRKKTEVGRTLQKWEKNIPYQTKIYSSAHTFFSPGFIGILNVTPDSFSDGGKHFSLEKAVEGVQRFLQQKVDGIDVGAESTRPGADSLSPSEEWKRLKPVLDYLSREKKQRKEEGKDFPWISVDTRNPETAEKAIEWNVDWINDVEGLKNPKMRRVLSLSSVQVVFMHSLTVPVQKEVTLPPQEDPVKILKNWAVQKIERLNLDDGISPERLIFVPGIGFGKTASQSFEIIRRSDEFLDLGVRVLMGHSRKSFLNLFTDARFSERDLETTAVSWHLAQLGIDYLRIHNLEDHRRMFRVKQALGEG